MRAQTLPERLLDGERTQLSDQLAVAPEGKVGLEALLERGQPDLLEPSDRYLREGLVREIGERCAAPE